MCLVAARIVWRPTWRGGKGGGVLETNKEKVTMRATRLINQSDGDKGEGWHYHHPVKRTAADAIPAAKLLLSTPGTPLG